MAIQDDNGIAKIKLTNFIGARVIQAYDENDHLEEGVFIPLERNGLHKNPKGDVNSYAFVSRAFFSNEDGWTHYLKLKITPEYAKKLKSLGYKSPYLGNFKKQNYIRYAKSYNEMLAKMKDYE